MSRSARRVSTSIPKTQACAALAAAALITFGAAAPARACKCMPIPVEQAAANAIAVFEGRVVKISEPSSSAERVLTVELSAVRSWKGVESERVEVTTATEGAACGYTFVAGASYLVYASATDGKLHVNSCGRTRPIADAGEDLRFLGMGATPVDPRLAEPPKPAAKPAEPPARGGCASCTVAQYAGQRSFMQLAAFALAGFAIRQRAKRRR